MARNTIILVFS